MSKRIILIISLIILGALVIVGKNWKGVAIKYKIKSIVNFSKPSLRIVSVGRHHGYWLPGNIRDILEKKYNLIFVGPDDKPYDLLFAGDLLTGEKLGYTGALKIFWTSEAYIPDLNYYDLVLGFNHIDSPKFIRLPYYYSEYKGDITTNKLSRQNLGKCTPQKSEFACFLVSNGATDFMAEHGNIAGGVRLRDSTFHALSEYKFIASGGKHLNNIGKTVPRGYKECMKWLGHCKFVIAYENQLYDGYMTEKVFQAYLAGAVPIYWGDKTAVSDINKEAVIYANDYSEKDLIDYIKKIDNDDELYCKIWNQPLLTNHDLNYDIVQDKLAKKLYELIDHQLKKRI